MKNLIRFVLTTVMALAGGAQAATYGVTSANYNTLINFTAPCGLVSRTVLPRLLAKVGRA